MKYLDTRNQSLAEISAVLKRPSVDEESLSPAARKKVGETFGRDMSVREVVETIVGDIRSRGDEALFSYIESIEGARLNSKTISVSAEEIEAAYGQVSGEFLSAVRLAKANIEKFHRRQVRESFTCYEPNGVVMGQRFTPIERVGVYVPGGTAAYPSSVLMNVIPARVAGVDKVYMATPAGPDGRVNPNILVAAKEAGVDAIFRMGGAQAVAALAFGTATVPKVDKIVGPGNIFVAVAKKMVFGNVGIDMIAGPSEIFIIADSNSNPRFVAADLLSQAEHDANAAAVLVTPSEELAEKVKAAVNELLADAPRKSIAGEALERCGAIVLTRDLDEAVALANEFAPEHLELSVKDPFGLIGKVRHAGAVFLGEWTPESLGDYTAGSNHVLPTNGTARFSSALGVDDFLKRTNIISFNMESLRKIGKETIDFAEAEGLDAHAGAVRVRMKD